MSQPNHTLVCMIWGLALLGIVVAIFACNKASKAGMIPLLRGLYNFPIRPPTPPVQGSGRMVGREGPPAPMGAGGGMDDDDGGDGSDPIGAFHAKSNDLGA